MAQRREKGTGGITHRKDGRWQGRYDVGIKPDGSRDTKYVYGKTEAECKRKLREAIKESHSKEYINVQKSSVRNYMQAWLADIKRNELKPKSYDRLEQTLLLYVYPRIGQIQLHALSARDVQKLINDLRDEGYAHSTIKKVYDAINACFKLGVMQKTVASNPALGVSVPSKKILPQQKIHFYTKDEAKKIIEQSQAVYKNGRRKYPLGSFVPLLLNTGLRAGELLALKWNEDVDTENRTITVHGNVAFVKNRDNDAAGGYKLIEQSSVKTQAGQNRVIPLNEAAIEALKDLRQMTGTSTYVMTTTNGTMVSPRNLDRIFRRIVKAAGLPDEKIYGVHSLRHTFATLLLSNGVDVKAVSELMGHSTFSVTYNTYIHIIEEQKRNAIDMLPNIL